MREERTRQQECSNCGAAATVKRDTYRFEESGLANVALLGIEVVVCKECGNADPIIPSTNDLMRVLALAVVAQPYRLGGEEIRFLRKYLGKTGQEFADLLDVTKSTVSKWENNDDDIGPQSDRLIRAITVGLTAGLKKEFDWVVKSFPNIKDGTRPNDIQINTENMSYQYA
jgi:YgiT-type zinc finger domain-containing protein